MREVICAIIGIACLAPVSPAAAQSYLDPDASVKDFLAGCSMIADASSLNDKAAIDCADGVMEDAVIFAVSASDNSPKICDVYSQRQGEYDSPENRAVELTESKAVIGWLKAHPDTYDLKHDNEIIVAMTALYPCKKQP